MKLWDIHLVFIDEEEGDDQEYSIRISTSRMAECFVNDTKTGQFQLTEDEICRLIKAKNGNEAAKILEE